MHSIKPLLTSMINAVTSICRQANESMHNALHILHSYQDEYKLMSTVENSIAIAWGVEIINK